jgi:hypothetical protein
VAVAVGQAPLVEGEGEGEQVGQELAEVFYTEYYPAAINMSLTHNRYLLFADAIKRENDGAPACGVPARGSRPVGDECIYRCRGSDRKVRWSPGSTR